MYRRGRLPQSGIWGTICMLATMFMLGMMIGREFPTSARLSLDTPQVFPSPRPVAETKVNLAEIPAIQIGKTVRRRVCDNTCPNAGNGVCNDGRPSKGQDWAVFYSKLQAVTCDLGTDCDDCGAWETDATVESESWRPVELLRSANSSLYVKKVTSPGGYLFGVTDPTLDTDVSRKVDEWGYFEPVLTQIWEEILGDCVDSEGRHRLVVDVGANFGYYTVLAAKRGCRVAAWEPVPLFAAYTQYNLLLNNLTHMVELRDKIVNDVQGARLSMRVPKTGIWGTAGVGGANLDDEQNGLYEELERDTERLDFVVDEDVLLIKADVEGFEPSVFRGARDLLRRHTVDNILMEYSPGVAERHHDWKGSAENPRMLAALLTAGYRLYDVAWALESDFPGFGKGASIPVLERVTHDMLRHDIADTERGQRDVLGCTFPEELATNHSGFLPDCNRLPDALHPFSYHSSFGYNTNVWATRWRGVSYSGYARAADPRSFNLSTDYFLESGYGTGRRPCGWFSDGYRIGNRCRCENRNEGACLEAEVAVVQAAWEGKMMPVEVPMVDTTTISINDW